MRLRELSTLKYANPSEKTIGTCFVNIDNFTVHISLTDFFSEILESIAQLMRTTQFTGRSQKKEFPNRMTKNFNYRISQRF